MKFLSFKINGKAKFGVFNEKKITDLTGKIKNALSLKELISINAIPEAKEYVLKNTGNISLDQIEYLPVIPNPGKIICVGLNYSDHIKETGKTLEKNPVIFVRVPDSQTSHKQSIQKPNISKYLDYECEMAVIMKDTNKYIKPEIIIALKV